MFDGDSVECAPPLEVFYDDELLDETNLYPPNAVRITREIGLNASPRPVTEAELVRPLEGVDTDPEPISAFEAAGFDCSSAPDRL